jgi:cupin 2 domain-containing protein
MRPQVTKLFQTKSVEAIGERVTRLLDLPVFRLEQIVSNGEASANGFWYDQPDAEWVLLLCGKATLRFAGEKPLKLAAGDSLLIPARSKHRVDSCSQDALWLALHFPADEPCGPVPAPGATQSL